MKVFRYHKTCSTEVTAYRCMQLRDVRMKLLVYYNEDRINTPRLKLLSSKAISINPSLKLTL